MKENRVAARFGVRVPAAFVYETAHVTSGGYAAPLYSVHLKNAGICATQPSCCWLTYGL